MMNKSSESGLLQIANQEKRGVATKSSCAAPFVSKLTAAAFSGKISSLLGELSRAFCGLKR